MFLPSLTPVQDDVLSALRNFLLTVLPSGVEVVLGQANRVAEPMGADFVVMTPTMRRRLETNTDIYADCAFNGSITGSTLSVTQMLHGAIAVGNQVMGTGVGAAVIYVSGTISGTGGTGTYALSGTLSNLPSQIFASGVLLAMMPVEITVQCDFHGPNSADYVQIASTLFRDDYAINAFEGYGAKPAGWGPIPVGGTLPVVFDGVRPLYADDPHQTPFINAEEQFENRWILDCCMQANQVVTVPQQFAASLRVGLIEVDTTYP